MHRRGRVKCDRRAAESYVVFDGSLPNARRLVANTTKNSP